LEDFRNTISNVLKNLEEKINTFDSKIRRFTTLLERIELENLLKTMVWTMDSGDRERWINIWSDDIHYIVPQYGLEINGKVALTEFAESAIFLREERRFSTLTNIMLDIDGDKAIGKDYYMHYGYPINPETGKSFENRAFSEGMHFYKFRKIDGEWKITDFEVTLNRRQEAES